MFPSPELYERLQISPFMKHPFRVSGIMLNAARIGGFGFIGLKKNGILFKSHFVIQPKQ
jgi:hypothetical protein